jgi:hypothetical protein
MYDYDDLVTVARGMQDVLLTAREKMRRHQQHQKLIGNREGGSAAWAFAQLLTACWNGLEQAVAREDPDVLRREIDSVEARMATLEEACAAVASTPPDDDLPSNAVRIPQLMS